MTIGENAASQARYAVDPEGGAHLIEAFGSVIEEDNYLKRYACYLIKNHFRQSVGDYRYFFL